MESNIEVETRPKNTDRPAPLTSPTSSLLLEQDEFANLTNLMHKTYTPVANIEEVIGNLLGDSREGEKTRLRALRGEEACRIMYSLQTVSSVTQVMCISGC